MSVSVTELEQPPVDAIALADVMQALGDPTRLAIVRSLYAEGERQCGSFDLGLSKATRSHHFRVLREAGITHTRVDGAARFVTLRGNDLEQRFPGLLTAIVNAASR
ncbi:MAG: ArsR/SmtB family transcription factor [Aeromicrobium sp.]